MFEPYLLQECHKTGDFGWNAPTKVALWGDVERDPGKV